MTILNLTLHKSKKKKKVESHFKVLCLGFLQPKAIPTIDLQVNIRKYHYSKQKFQTPRHMCRKECVRQQPEYSSKLNSFSKLYHKVLLNCIQKR